MFVAGTIDECRHFHPTFLAVSSHEDSAAHEEFFRSIDKSTGHSPTHLLADAAHAITNASAAVWPNCCRLTCWAHVYRAVEKKIPTRDKNLILGQIKTLQFARSTAQFKAGESAPLTRILLFFFSRRVSTARVARKVRRSVHVRALLPERMDRLAA